MKKPFFFLPLFLLGTSLWAAPLDTLTLSSKVTDVTVFFSGAQVTRKAEAALAKGKHVLLLEGLPNEINPQSIQVAHIENSTLLFVKHDINSQFENIRGTEKEGMDKQIRELEKEIVLLGSRINVLDIEEELLMDNRMFQNKEKGASVSEIKEAADFYKARLNDIRDQKLNYLLKLETLDEAMKKAYVKMNELINRGANLNGQIYITLDCKKELKTTIQVSYFTSLASWMPLYDFRVEDIENPLQIVYNAHVQQTSGEKWENVNVKLSTSNPTLSGTKPALETWHIDKMYAQQKVTPDFLSTQKGIFKGVVTDKETGEPLPYVSITVFQNSYFKANVLTDINGAYGFKTLEPGQYTVEYKFMGYEPVQNEMVYVNIYSPTVKEVQMEIITMEDKVASVVDGASKIVLGGQGRTSELNASHVSKRIPLISGIFRRSNKKYIRTMRSFGGATMETDYISNKVRMIVTSMEYDIEVPYTIPTDGNNYTMKIKEVQVPVDYTYYTVPKIEESVFLSASINNWQDLHLLPGKSNIYFQGTFVGESTLNVEQISDTLSVSLGRDKNIVIKREENKQLVEKKFIGNSAKRIAAYDIIIKNNKNTPIKLVVEDQFPVSENRAVEVERLEYSNAKLDEKTGKLTWNLHIEPNGKQNLHYKFSVKYPRNTTIYF